MSLIRIEGVTKSYPGGEGPVEVLHGLSLSIAAGEFVAVVGPSGSGKSTLLSILGGLNPPTAGRLTVDGIDVYQLDSERRADFRNEYVGFVFQEFQLLPYLSALQNVMLPLAISGQPVRRQAERGRAVLERVGLDGKAHRLPGQLSGGEQERVAIARALVNEPPVILADEPTGALDTTTGDRIMELFAGLNAEGQTIIMVTHNLDNLRFASRVLAMRDGRVDRWGPEAAAPARPDRQVKVS